MSFNDVEGLVRDLNPGPLAPEASIIPLDQQALIERKVYMYKYMVENNVNKQVIKISHHHNRLINFLTYLPVLMKKKIFQ